jgi:hypothetical protein
MSGRSEKWPTPLRAIVLGAGQTGRGLFPNLFSAPLKKPAPETLEISAEGDRIVPLNASTHEQYLDKTIENSLRLCRRFSFSGKTLRRFDGL